jgi:hypothetical protein
MSFELRAVRWAMLALMIALPEIMLATWAFGATWLVPVEAGEALAAWVFYRFSYVLEDRWNRVR